MLGRLRLTPQRARFGKGRAVFGGLPAPGEQRRVVWLAGNKSRELWIMAPVGRAASIGQKDDRRLEALARVHRQHAHAVALGFHVALDRRVGRLDFREEKRERRGFPLFMVDSQRQKLVDRVGGVRAEPGEQSLAAAVLAKQPRVKAERRQALRSSAPERQPPRGRERSLVAQARERRGERPGAAGSQSQQIVIAEADQR